MKSLYEVSDCVSLDMIHYVEKLHLYRTSIIILYIYIILYMSICILLSTGFQVDLSDGDTCRRTVWLHGSLGLYMFWQSKHSDSLLVAGIVWRDHLLVNQEPLNLCPRSNIGSAIIQRLCVLTRCILTSLKLSCKIISSNFNKESCSCLQLFGAKLFLAFYAFYAGNGVAKYACPIGERHRNTQTSGAIGWQIINVAVLWFLLWVAWCKMAWAWAGIPNQP